MKSHDVAGEYGALLESLEIPIKPLKSTSVGTPEWEVLHDIRTHFGIPGGIETRAPLVGYLSSHVPLDDFFSFVGFLIKPFARMVVEIYDFLSRFERTAASGQTVTQIRIGSRTTFPVNLKFMPRELLKMLTQAFDRAWNFDALWPLYDSFPNLKLIARCDGKHGGRTCRPDCFQHCREGIASVVEASESILLTDAKNAEFPGDLLAERSAGETEAVAGPARLDSVLRESFESLVQAYAEAGTSGRKFASDCLPTQKPGLSPAELYTQKRIRQAQEVLEGAATEIKVLRDEVKEFLRLPYWRRRNDLYEVWVLTKVCSLFTTRRLELCNLDELGHWKIPGNGQGRIDEPILKLAAPSGTYRVYTGLNLKGYQHQWEKTGRVRGGMPDWLFCREVSDFDFDLFNAESDRFQSQGVIPEFIVECKAGASYGLSETVEQTMRARYLPLLRTGRGRAVLVNYRQFYVPAGLDKRPDYRDSIKRRYTQILAVDSLAPGAVDAEAEFLQVARETFGLSVSARQEVDLMLVVDTTGSMEPHLDSLKDGWAECVEAVTKGYSGARFGVVAVGDHDDVYDVLLSPLADGVESISFLSGVADTSGGDTPEAYEDALHVLAALPWREGAARIVIFIGDAYPHPAQRCPNGFDWENELSLLKTLRVVIHGVRIVGRLKSDFPEEDRESAAFFNRICAETDGRLVEITSGSDVLSAILDLVTEP